MRFRVKQWLKMLLQNRILPFVYWINSWRKIDDKLVIFADAHHTARPESMRQLYVMLSATDCQIVEMYTDYSALGVMSLLGVMCTFMKMYAKAGTVVICDNFLPVAACRKKERTKVIQLWHGCGAFKKFGYDAKDDIPSYYKGEVYKNYDLVPVSSEACVKYFASAMHQKEGKVKAYGISRTDAYFVPSYLENCREAVYRRYPKLRGKKILLWAPTFRGNAAMPTMEGMNDIHRLERELGDEWQVIYSLHPHLYGYFERGKSETDLENEIFRMEFSTEQLIPVADVFVTDYSSVMYDAALMNCPLLMYAPDLEQFRRERGFYMPLEDFPGMIITEGMHLKAAVLDTIAYYDLKKQKTFCEKYLSACDGKATDRIVRYIIEGERIQRRKQ